MSLEESRYLVNVSSNTKSLFLGKTTHTSSYIVPDTNVIRDFMLLDAVEELRRNFAQSKFIMTDGVVQEISKYGTSATKSLEIIGGYRVNKTGLAQSTYTVLGMNVYEDPPLIQKTKSNKKDPSQIDQEIAITTRALSHVAPTMSLSGDWFLRELGEMRWIENHGTIWIIANIVASGTWTPIYGERNVTWLLKNGRYVGSTELYNKTLKDIYEQRRSKD